MCGEIEGMLAGVPFSAWTMREGGAVCGEIEGMGGANSVVRSGVGSN